MKRPSAGILLYRYKAGELEVLLVHPGGPFWARKDLGAWTIPKGERLEGEDDFTAARREFQEETGTAVDGDFLDLGEVRQSGGKIVHAWALERDLDPSRITSNSFEMEWPPKSGIKKEFPEIDRGDWFNLAVAATKLLPSQLPFLDRLAALRRKNP